MSILDKASVASQVERFFTKDVILFANTLANIESSISPTAVPEKDDVFDDLNSAIGKIREACCGIEQAIGDDQDLLKGVQDQYREQITPWFGQSWFMHRAITKPRGYSGDYLTLAAIYDRKPKATGIGGYLDLFFLNTTLGRAVAERLQNAREFLIDEVSRRRGDIRVLNVACGPCREYVGGWNLPEDCNAQVTCIDYDTEALEYVASNVVKSGPNIPDIECVRYNALRMRSAKSNIKQFGKCDIIYSVGLCDYIPDKQLVAMLKGLRETLADGGVLYIAFKDMMEYDKTDYQWLTDWFFLQRTEEECRELLRQGGFEESDMKMSRDSTRSIMNFACRAKQAAILRTDVGEDVPASPSRRETKKPAPRLDADQAE